MQLSSLAQVTLESFGFDLFNSLDTHIAAGLIVASDTSLLSRIHGGFSNCLGLALVRTVSTSQVGESDLHIAFPLYVTRYLLDLL